MLSSLRLNNDLDASTGSKSGKGNSMNRSMNRSRTFDDDKDASGSTHDMDEQSSHQ